MDNIIEGFEDSDFRHMCICLITELVFGYALNAGETLRAPVCVTALTETSTIFLENVNRTKNLNQLFCPFHYIFDRKP